VSVLSELRAVSSAQNWETWLERVTRAALDSSAATSALLVMMAPEPRVRAELRAWSGFVTQLDAPADSTRLSSSVLDAVRASGKSLVLDDAASELGGVTDHQLAARGACSVACVPLHRGDRVEAALYVESTSPGAFAGARLQLLELLAAQAEAWLEKVHLEARLEQALRSTPNADHTRDALQRTQSALANMTRVASLGEMAAAIAHEVNQPLSAIGLNASTCLRLMDSGRLDDLQDAREAAQRIQRDARRASLVIQRVRSLFSKSTGVREPLDLNEAVREVVALTRSRFRECGATVSLRLEESVALALGDRVQLQQVVLNLLLNALEAVDDVTDRPRLVEIRTAQEGESLWCAVKDNGRGIEDADLGRLFGAFYSTKPNGMGIGLFISRTIVEEHGGAIRAQRSPDEPGACFCFSVPLARR
jgi:C4-dicarboxylate-specific signal transduction histidine kinase